MLKKRTESAERYEALSLTTAGSNACPFACLRSPFKLSGAFYRRVQRARVRLRLRTLFDGCSGARPFHLESATCQLRMRSLIMMRE
eukprot:COSAG06_NODE_995_length_11158_cov_10.796184_12_plen_86_part_00